MFPGRIFNEKSIIIVVVLLLGISLTAVSGTVSAVSDSKTLHNQTINVSDVDKIKNSSHTINSLIGTDDEINVAIAVDGNTDSVTESLDANDSYSDSIDVIPNNTSIYTDVLLDNIHEIIDKSTNIQTIEQRVDEITDDAKEDYTDTVERTINDTTNTVDEVTRPTNRTTGNVTDIVNNTGDEVRDSTTETIRETTETADQPSENVTDPSNTNSSDSASTPTPSDTVSEPSTPRNKSRSNTTTERKSEVSTTTTPTDTQQREPVSSENASSTTSSASDDERTETVVRTTANNTNNTSVSHTTTTSTNATSTTSTNVTTATPTNATSTTSTNATTVTPTNATISRISTATTTGKWSASDDESPYRSATSDNGSDGLSEGEDGSEHERSGDLNVSSSVGGSSVPVTPAPETGAAIGLAAVAAGAIARHGDIIVAVSSTPSTTSTSVLIISRSGFCDRCRTINPFSRMFTIFRYSRYDDSDPLEHEGRESVFEAIEETPGVYLSAVSERTGLSLSTIRHHLQVLEQESLVMSVKVHGKRRFYPAYSEQVELTAALNDEATANVIDALSRLGSASVSELAEDLDRDPSTVTHHLQRLADDGIVVRERDGRTVMNRLSSNVHTILTDGVATDEMERAGNVLSSSAD
jgi:DNA-binding transcriptional ArsR family regulator